ncbi:Uncharacterized protein ChrSV_0300 [Chromobacterium vaccinii]|nr:Uncharacterized protein ChrSW_0300 [Chromobacterium vaccinii]QND87759.1 Uncharacterized protein ChrSV_0300 [Chromobacterium vaccinii]
MQHPQFEHQVSIQNIHYWYFTGLFSQSIITHSKLITQQT